MKPHHQIGKKNPIRSLHDECHINEFKVDRSGVFVAELWCELHIDAKKYRFKLDMIFFYSFDVFDSFVVALQRELFIASS
ncbi:unnamed protein product [Trifolium pratense]|uniref:Uncharacterized protein n=1 Tax=Trifolium pratense TaxID=57577 RepID=A0ACB0MD73_TRIPR|nr:unnamed protein product [Trifolium pratense]